MHDIIMSDYIIIVTCVYSIIIIRSTLVEVLHTILLGPYKYLTRKLISRLSPKQKEQVQAYVCAFNFSGFNEKFRANLCPYFRSFVGRDFKGLGQFALFVIRAHFSTEALHNKPIILICDHPWINQPFTAFIQN